MLEVEIRQDMEVPRMLDSTVVKIKDKAMDKAVKVSKVKAMDRARKVSKVKAMDRVLKAIKDKELKATDRALKASKGKELKATDKGKALKATDRTLKVSKDKALKATDTALKASKVREARAMAKAKVKAVRHIKAKPLKILNLLRTNRAEGRATVKGLLDKDKASKDSKADRNQEQVVQARTELRRAVLRILQEKVARTFLVHPTDN